MDYIRSFDIGSLDAGRFDYQMLADLETCYVIVCRSPAGSGGPDTHVHDCDQFYYVLDGTMNVVFGETEYTAEPDRLSSSCGHGTPQLDRRRPTRDPHRPPCPPPVRGEAMSRPADPHKTGPSEPCVCRADEARAMSGRDGQVVTPIAAPQGTAGMSVNVVRAGAAAPTASGTSITSTSSTGSWKGR